VNGWILTATLTLGAGLAAALWGVTTGPPRRRVVTQNLLAAVARPGPLLPAQAYDRRSYVDLALVLALLGPVGTLVFARLLAGELVPHQATFALSTTVRRRRSSAWRFRQMM
jgi:multisubunit Na+/H+ antiporter MnhF subunit